MPKGEYVIRIRLSCSHRYIMTIIIIIVVEINIAHSHRVPNALTYDKETVYTKHCCYYYYYYYY